jgi:hypothetical protein
VILEWDRPSDSRIEGYRIHYGTESGNYTELLQVAGAGSTNATISGLRLGRTYYFAATSYNGTQESDYTKEVVHTPADSDGDNLSDYDESQFYSTDPEVSDTDGDGIEDGTELAYWNDLEGHSWDGDIDGDGTENLLDPDADGDGIQDGSELDHGQNPTDSSDGLQETLQIASDEILVNHQWTSYELPEGFTNPIVVAGPLSGFEADPSVLRIRNATAESFEIRLQEYPYLDGSHTIEVVGYLALEAGSYKLDNGTLVEAGRFTTSASGDAFHSVSYVAPFAQAPVVATSVESFNHSEAVAGRIRSTSASGFEYQMQEQEGSDQVVSSESVAYVAWAPSSGQTNSTVYEVRRSGDEVTDVRHNLGLKSGFIQEPVLLGAMQTRNSPDTASLRWLWKNATQASIRVQEEKSADSETGHTTEAVGYMAFEPTNATTRTVVFGNSPGADANGTVRDTFININHETNIENNRLNTYTWPEDTPANAVLIRCDLSRLPEDATIENATLKLYQTAAGGDARYDVSVHRIVNHDPDLARATGYTFNGADGWTPNSVCYNDIPLAQTDIAEATAVRSLDQSSGFKSWDITGVAQYWKENPGLNFGLLVNSDANASSNSHRFFASSEAANGSTRPALEVTYSSASTVDNDGDGLTDSEELGTYGTDPQDADTDGDGLSDSEEIQSTATDPETADTDSDGLQDGAELETYSTDPLTADSDHDGLDDGEEVASGTDPLEPDTDNDGLDDGTEVTLYSTDPLAPDTDQDGLDDRQELNDTETDPTVADTDGDGANDGDEVAQGRDPNREEITSPRIARGEIRADHQWTAVSHGKTFSDPVVVAGPLTLNSSDPAVVRVRNVNATGFEVRVDEYEYQDENHPRETVAYLVMERGRFRLNNATNIETGSFQASGTYPDTGIVDFSSPLAESPVVLTSIVSENEAQAVSGRIQKVTTDGFEFGMQEEEAGDGQHADETVHYVAWEPSGGTYEDMTFEATKTGYTIDNTPANLPFEQSYEKTPFLLAGMQTCDETDAASLRLQGKDSTSADLLIDEEQSADLETTHVTEDVGMLVLESNVETAIFGNTPEADYTGTLEDTFININTDVNSASGQLNTYTWPENTPANAILIKVDLSLLPEGARIKSATLKLYQTAAGGDALYDVSVHKVLNVNPDLSQANGYSYDGINDWTANDVCYNSIPLAQEDIDSAKDVNSLDQTLEYKSWDVTQLVQDWVNNTSTNNSLLLNSDDAASSDSYRFFASGEANDGSQRPRLEVTYTKE